MPLHKKPVLTKKELFAQRRAAALAEAEVREASGKKKRKKSRKRRQAERVAETAPLPERQNNMILVAVNSMQRVTHCYGNATRQPFKTEALAQRAAARLDREHPETKFFIIPLRQAPYVTNRSDEY